jgi:hypothetical protein
LPGGALSQNLGFSLLIAMIAIQFQSVFRFSSLQANSRHRKQCEEKTGIDNFRGYRQPLPDVMESKNPPELSVLAGF